MTTWLLNIYSVSPSIFAFLEVPCFCAYKIIYLLDRGFTQTFQVFESEKNRDKTKRFDVTRVVEVLLGLQHYNYFCNIL